MHELQGLSRDGVEDGRFTVGGPRLTNVRGVNSPSPTIKNRGSGEPVKRICADCPEPARTERSTYCEKHRRERQLNKWRNTPSPVNCEACGLIIEKPYKSDQKYHDECAKGGYAARRDERRGSGDDPQMERLIRGYQARPDIHITDRPDGTRVMIVSDHQLPFVDERLLKAQMQFMADFRPHDLIINGDFIDCYEISDFDHDPRRQFTIGDELRMAEGILYDFGKRLAQGGKMYFVEGNHEERLRRYVWRHAGALVDIVPDLDTLLNLDKHCAGTVPYGKAIDYLGYTITHGNYVSQYSAYTAKRHADRYRSSGCNGHTHRMGSYSFTDGKGRSHTWDEIGCACRIDLEYVRGIANWQQGFQTGVVFNNALHTQLVRVIDYDDDKRGFYAAGKHYVW